jgi:hypothetical protein
MQRYTLLDFLDRVDNVLLVQKWEHFASFFVKKKISLLKKKRMELSLEKPQDLQGGAIFESRVINWIDSIFEKDLASNRINIHPERLIIPEGLEKYSSPQEAILRSDVYNFNAILNSYRIRQLCTLEKNGIVPGESLLHAHADLFLSKAYAAWNLSGRSRLDFESNLNNLTNPTITMLFTGNAPVCSSSDGEIVESYELKSDLNNLKIENANFQAFSAQAADEMEVLQNKLKEKEKQIKFMEENLSDSIQAGLMAKDKQLQDLREQVDLIVASALQEQQDTREDLSSKYPERIARLEANIKNLEKDREQLEYYLRLAREALVEKKQKILLDGKFAPPRSRSISSTEEDDFESSDDDSEAFSTEIPMSSVKMEEDDTKTLKKRPQKGCIIM